MMTQTVGEQRSLTTSLAGRVRNTSLPKSHALLPLMEAVVNGLQAIDERFGVDTHQGRLTIKVVRSAQTAIDLKFPGPGRAPLEPIVGFVVEDNGEGFTEPNMVSFRTLDSDHKAAHGGRGVGRLLWLKAFEGVTIESAYLNPSGNPESRALRFSITSGVVEGASQGAPEQPGSVVTLNGFKSEYQKNAPKSGEAIAREIMEHCLWYFLRPGGAPRIDLLDDERISINGMFSDLVTGDVHTSRISLGSAKFDLVSVRARSFANTTPRLYWCAASRVVIEESLAGKIPGLHGRLEGGGEEFIYLGFLSGDYLDQSVRADRTAFDIPERVAGALDADEISMEAIRRVVLAELNELLKESLGIARAKGRHRLDRFVSTKAPRYRSVLRQMEEAGMPFDPGVSDRELELQLHRNLRDLELSLLTEGQEVLDELEAGLNGSQTGRLQGYLAKLDDLKKSDLAAYVSRRRVVLDILQSLIELDDDGKYAREEAIHALLMPMRKESTDVSVDASNLWLLDERLAFHDFLASDKTLRSMPITDSHSTREPDLLATRLVDSPVLVSEGVGLPLASISVVEIKRPMRNDGRGEDKNPIHQAGSYVDEVRRGGVKTASGRPIPESQNIPGFAYIVADLTPSMVEHCRNANLRPTHDGLGWFGYNDVRKLYIEVISFDKLLNAAKERNRAFFDKLGLPVT